jgi:hypothetical protein
MPLWSRRIDKKKKKAEDIKIKYKKTNWPGDGCSFGGSGLKCRPTEPVSSPLIKPGPNMMIKKKCDERKRALNQPVARMNGQKKSRFENEAPNEGKRCRECARKRPPGKEIGYRTGGGRGWPMIRASRPRSAPGGGGRISYWSILFCRQDGRVGYVSAICRLRMLPRIVGGEGADGRPGSRAVFLSWWCPSIDPWISVPSARAEILPRWIGGICWVRSMRVRAPKRLKSLSLCRNLAC